MPIAADCLKYLINNKKEILVEEAKKNSAVIDVMIYIKGYLTFEEIELFITDIIPLSSIDELKSLLSNTEESALGFEKLFDLIGINQPIVDETKKTSLDLTSSFNKAEVKIIEKKEQNGEEILQHLAACKKQLILLKNVPFQLSLLKYLSSSESRSEEFQKALSKKLTNKSDESIEGCEKEIKKEIIKIYTALYKKGIKKELNEDQLIGDLIDVVEEELKTHLPRMIQYVKSLVPMISDMSALEDLKQVADKEKMSDLSQSISDHIENLNQVGNEKQTVDYQPYPYFDSFLVDSEKD
jgi:hypothetical protein